MRKIIIYILLALFTSSASFATKYAGEFLNFGLDARALGMGGAYVSVAEGGFGSYWNPGGSANGGHQVIFNHSANFDSLLTYDALGYCRPLKNGGLGIIFLRLAVKDIPNTSDALIDLNGNGLMDPGERLDYGKITYFDDTESALFINYSRKYRPNLAVGANLKLINKSLGENKAWGMGLDMGALFSGPHRLNYGLNLSDITTTYLAWDTGTKELITPAARLGISWNPVLKNGHPVILSLGLDVRFENRRTASQYHIGNISSDAHYGAEYMLIKSKTSRHNLSLRLGSDAGRLSAGTGIKLGNLNFDYSYLGSLELGASNRISAALSF